MLLSSAEVFQVLSDQGFELLLFFEEKFEHEALREEGPGPAE
jgi:hypothetical protein